MTVLTACGGKSEASPYPITGGSVDGGFDQSDPGKVVQRLFEAAKADDPKMLTGLCDPEKQNDGDTDCLCALDPAYVPHQCAEDSRNRVSWEEFKAYFQNGSLAGKPTIAGNEASVPFYFGENGTDTETMALVQSDKQWYMSSF